MLTGPYTVVVGAGGAQALNQGAILVLQRVQKWLHSSQNIKQKVVVEVDLNGNEWSPCEDSGGGGGGGGQTTTMVVVFRQPGQSNPGTLNMEILVVLAVTILVVVVEAAVVVNQVVPDLPMLGWCGRWITSTTCIPKSKCILWYFPGGDPSGQDQGFAGGGGGGNFGQDGGEGGVGGGGNGRILIQFTETLIPYKMALKTGKVGGGGGGGQNVGPADSAVLVVLVLLSSHILPN